MPGYAAPEMACMVVTMHDSIGPKVFSSAQRGMTRPVVEQFALVRMKPFLRGELEGVLMSGTTKGTWGGVAAVVFGVGEDGEVGVSKGALHWAC